MTEKKIVQEDKQWKVYIAQDNKIINIIMAEDIKYACTYWEGKGITNFKLTVISNKVNNKIGIIPIINLKIKQPIIDDAKDSVKPPIGVKPKYIHKEFRMSELAEGIKRYIDHGYTNDACKHSLHEWITELSELLEI